MDIAALSTNLSQMKVAQQVGLSVMKMAMDTAKIQSADLAQLVTSNSIALEQSVNPHLGHNLDVQG